eukprot:6188299-Pleurochrysis_carterae.AAC.2
MKLDRKRFVTRSSVTKRTPSGVSTVAVSHAPLSCTAFSGASTSRDARAEALARVGCDVARGQPGGAAVPRQGLPAAAREARPQSARAAAAAGALDAKLPRPSRTQSQHDCAIAALRSDTLVARRLLCLKLCGAGGRRLLRGPHAGARGVPDAAADAARWQAVEHVGRHAVRRVPRRASAAARPAAAAPAARKQGEAAAAAASQGRLEQRRRAHLEYFFGNRRGRARARGATDARRAHRWAVPRPRARLRRRGLLLWPLRRLCRADAHRPDRIAAARKDQPRRWTMVPQRLRQPQRHFLAAARRRARHRYRRRPAHLLDRGRLPRAARHWRERKRMAATSGNDALNIRISLSAAVAMRF